MDKQFLKRHYSFLSTAIDFLHDYFVRLPFPECHSLYVEYKLYIFIR